MKPYECVRRFWQDRFPSWPVITADGGGAIFNLGAARNNAARQAQSDILVFADADTIPPLESVRIAVADPVGVCWPHASWRLIPAEYADRPFDEFATAPILVDYPEGLGGCMITTANEFWRLGGQPEEFDQGWGHEDRSFHCIVQTLSSFRRIGGIAFSIEHNQKLRIADSLGWDRNSQRNREKARPYENATGRPWLMKELLVIRDEPPPEAGQDWRGRSGSRETDPVRRALYWTRASSVPPSRPDWHARWTTPDD
jgi:hypothetical protein